MTYGGRQDVRNTTEGRILPGRLLANVTSMPACTFEPLRPFPQFVLDTAAYSAFGAIPVGRLRGRHAVAVVAASAAVGAIGTFLALHTRGRARRTAVDGWMPWTPQGRTESPDPTVTAGEVAEPRSREDRRQILRASAVAVVAGGLSGGATALGIAADRRMEAFFTNRGVQHPRLSVGLSQGLGYAALTNLIAAAVNSREKRAGVDRADG